MSMKEKIFIFPSGGNGVILYIVEIIAKLNLVVRGVWYFFSQLGLLNHNAIRCHSCTKSKI